MKKKSGATPTRSCLLQSRQEAACAPPEGKLPICGRHRDDLNRRFTAAVPGHVRENFMEKGDNAFIFNRKNGTVYSLNATGTFIFREFLAGRDFCAVLEEMDRRFEVGSDAELLDDVKHFWETLRDAELLQVDHEIRS